MVLCTLRCKRKLRKVWYRDHFLAVDAMLWDARLSPAFWADALAYLLHCCNRVPSLHLGGEITLWQLLTGERSRWDKFRVLGCDVFAQILNNALAKGTWLAEGSEAHYVGFKDGRSGFKVFDSESRRYHYSGAHRCIAAP